MDWYWDFFSLVNLPLASPRFNFSYFFKYQARMYLFYFEPGARVCLLFFSFAILRKRSLHHDYKWETKNRRQVRKTTNASALDIWKRNMRNWNEDMREESWQTSRNLNIDPCKPFPPCLNAFSLLSNKLWNTVWCNTEFLILVIKCRDHF